METENIICWTGKQRKIIWLVCVRAVHGLRTAMSPQFSTTTYCVVLLNQHGNPPQHCHVPCHGGSMEGSRAAQTLTLSSIDRGVLRFFSGVQQQQYIYSYTQTPKPTQSRIVSSCTTILLTPMTSLFFGGWKAYSIGACPPALTHTPLQTRIDR